MSVRSTVIEKWGMSVRSTVIEKWGMSVRSAVIEKWGMSVCSNPKFGCAFSHVGFDFCYSYSFYFEAKHFFDWSVETNFCKRN